MGQDIAQLAAFVDRARCLHADVTGYASGGRKLAEEGPHSLGIAADGRVDLAVGALEVDIGDDRRSAMPWSGQVDCVDIALLDQAIEMDIDQVQTGRGAPVSEQPRLDVLGLEWFA